MVFNQSESAESAKSEVHLRVYWSTLWQGRWTVAAVFLLILCTVAVYSFSKDPIYRAVAVVEIQPEARRLAPVQDVSGLGAAGYGWFAEEKYKNTQMEIIRSRDVGERAYRLLGLDLDPRFQDAKDPIGMFQKMVLVQPRRETGLIEIIIQGLDRNEAARWANAVADSYVNRNLENARENAQMAVRAIEQLIQPLRAGLSEAEKHRFEILREQEIYNPENQKKIVSRALSDLNEELSSTKIEIGKLEAQLSKIGEMRNSGNDPMMLPELARDTVLQDLHRQKVDLEKQLESAKVTYRPGHRAYQEKFSELEKINQRIDNQVTLLLGKIRNEYELAQENRRYLQNEIRKAEEADYRVGLATSEYDMVKTDAETKKQIYDLISRQLSEVNLSSELLANNVAVLDYAVPPLRPVKPNKRLNLLLGSMVGMFMGIGFVFFLDYLDHTFKNPEELEKVLGMKALAVIPKKQDGDRNKRILKEAFQSLRTGMIFSSLNRQRNCLLVTSTAPQEGKSSTVADLARTLAGAGDRVILLDCDLRRPTQHFHLQVAREPGLSNYLAAPMGQDGWKPFVKQTDVAGLDVITCGPIPPNPPELLGGERFQTMLDELKKIYDWVLMDSPPSMSLADSVLLASKADMVLVVIRYNETDRAMVRKSVQNLRNMGATLIGAVLNSVNVDHAHNKDYYYAGYYYEEDGKKERKKNVVSEI